MEKKFLQGLMSELNRYKEELVEPQEGMRDSLAAAKEDKHLHVQAFKAVWRLARMTPEKRSDFLRAFDEYRDALDLDAQLDMLDSAA